MKATGIIRRIDDLGRVVIPREIRTQLGIREGEPLEIYLDKTAGGHPVVCFAKYSTTFESDLASLAVQITNSMDDCREYELSDKFRKVIKEAKDILEKFENRD
jgi:AbrB family looped-hinge helix DNA binding protein